VLNGRSFKLVRRRRSRNLREGHRLLNDPTSGGRALGLAHSRSKAHHILSRGDVGLVQLQCVGMTFATFLQ
jgi:hypothetical protein